MSVTTSEALAVLRNYIRKSIPTQPVHGFPGADGYRLRHLLIRDALAALALIEERLEELEREVEVLTKQSDDWQTEASRFEAALTRRALGKDKP